MVKFKDLEELYDVSLSSHCTIVIRVDGKNFSKLLKSYGPCDKDHTEAMILATIEAAKVMQNFVLAHVQSDEVSFILSNEDYKDTQGWFNHRIQKCTTIAGSAVSVNYSILMSSYKNSLVRGLFDARIFDIAKDSLADYLSYRIRNCYCNTIAKVYSVEVGKNNHKNVSNMEAELTEKAIYVDNLFKFGTIIVHDNREYSRVPVESVYDDLKSFSESVFESILRRKTERCRV